MNAIQCKWIMDHFYFVFCCCCCCFLFFAYSNENECFARIHSFWRFCIPVLLLSWSRSWLIAYFPYTFFIFFSSATHRFPFCCHSNIQREEKWKKKKFGLMFDMQLANNLFCILYIMYIGNRKCLCMERVLLCFETKTAIYTFQLKR